MRRLLSCAAHAVHGVRRPLCGGSAVLYCVLSPAGQRMMASDHSEALLLLLEACERPLMWWHRLILPCGALSHEGWCTGAAALPHAALHGILLAICCSCGESLPAAIGWQTGLHWGSVCWVAHRPLNLFSPTGPACCTLISPGILSYALCKHSRNDIGANSLAIYHNQ